MYSIQNITDIIEGRLTGESDVPVRYLAYDSRKIQHPEASLFFAIKTAHNDGARFIAEAYKKGVRAFVVSHAIELESAAVIIVRDTLVALQTLAAHHRKQYHLPVIGITGSNGKTVVKEWLNTLLEEDYRIVRSPKSFNSQIGVPLSVWEIKKEHQLGIFEAGISQRGEMDALEKIIQPTIGILTNIGEAHSEGFASEEEKLKEKLQLFTNSEMVIGQRELLNNISNKKFTWSYKPGGDVQVGFIKKGKEKTIITVAFNNKEIALSISFTDDASIQNSITCLCVLLYLGMDESRIQQRFGLLHSIDMRLQLNHAINHCLLINDSYSADTTSLKIALDFLSQQSVGLKRTVVLSDFYESGKASDILYGEIAQLVNHFKINKLIAIGENIGRELQQRLHPSIVLETYLNTGEYIQLFKSSDFHREIILLKGARKAGFERIASLFEQKLHGTVLQINLSAVVHNLKEYQKQLRPSTKIMAMVKAFAYGSGGAEIASVLQFHNTAYLGVAYADEGVELVKSGITIPIMVMNAEPSSFAAIVENNLEPVLYSTQLLKQFEAYTKEQGLTGYPVHLEIETGMNRLGFALEEIEAVAKEVAASSFLTVQSVFSH
ncbi:MAG: UDP-N-acetylmuramoyl-tripeptide--D-alanyl-D-alanine ligase, partial [Bacteroidota bacterium]|nr:UDP-N-acetylmuramoyl-tripeptide--D-alanyl-D-alanine ligase [Bacteroidota bacterium]